MVDATIYTEAFVEAGEWRWRVCESDPGLIEIHYQEWDDKNRQWKNPDELGPHLSFASDYADAICKAIQRVKAGV
jgi:hypothetical protein